MSSTTATRAGGVWDRWGPQLPLGTLVALYGLIQSPNWGSLTEYVAVIAVLIGAAVAISRRSPAMSLALAWVSGAVQIATGSPVLSVQLALLVVAYGCARWGSTVTIWASGVSIPSGVFVAISYLGTDPLHVLARLDPPTSLIAERFPGPNLTYAVLAVGLLTTPWLAGLVVRFSARASTSRVSQQVAEADAAQAQVEAGQAQEIARLREEQSRMARDVHDVVGHSLAVILAQAESAQYLPDDPAALKQTMATIAGSARSSLQDVRHVLAGPEHPSPPARTGAFEQLLDGVRAGGHEVLAAEVGTARPLSPELDVVAHRVVQEMLTNAIRHGRRDEPVHVERHWPDGGFENDLRIEVRNVADEPAALDDTMPITSVPADPEPPGQGLDGMRRRLDSVGGRLDVRRRAEATGTTFTVTAWVPVSGR